MTTKQQQKIEHARALRDAGYSYQQIGDYFDVKAGTVRGWLDPEFAAAERKKFAARNFKKARGWN